MNADARLAALRRRLADSEAEALFVTCVSNVVYLTGFDGVFDADASAACLVTRDEARVYTDSRYAEAAGLASQGTAWSVTVSANSLDARMCEDLTGAGARVLAFETSLTYARHRVLSEHSGARLLATEQWVEELREVKEAAELERISGAAALTDRAFEHILGVLALGMTESEVAVELESFMRRNGSEGVAFPSIVASGPNSSRPHASVTDRRIERGDALTMDFGARIGGYCADMTRTVVIGKATEEFQRVYEAVRAANIVGREAMRAGVPGVDIDRAARDSLDAVALGEHFGHGLGHGVGLDVHELPVVSPRDTRPVPVGAVVTVEPGAYLEGRFGVRIEDLVVIEDGGCRTLTASRRDLIEV
ncbi:MAG: M24 family metallopeptidase [Coriobacteriia bacterium]|nr:M24 family metallopeptidase [Coriobacteriia bacterium]